MIFVFLLLTYFTLYITGSSFIHLSTTDSNLFLLWLSNVSLHIYVPHHPYPFISQWTSRLLPCPKYFK